VAVSPLATAFLAAACSAPALAASLVPCPAASDMLLAIAFPLEIGVLS